MGYPPPPKSAQLPFAVNDMKPTNRLTDTQSPVPNPQGTKRTIDTSSSPDTKRARVVKPVSPSLKNAPIAPTHQPEKRAHAESSVPPTQPTTHSSTASTVPQLTHAPPPSTSADSHKDVLQPSTHPQHATPSSAVGAKSLQDAIVKLRVMEEAVKKREEMALAAEKVGNIEEARKIRAAQAQTKETYDKAKLIIMNTLRSAHAPHATKSEETSASSPSKSRTGDNSSPPKPVSALPGPSHSRTPSQDHQQQSQVPLLPSGTPSQLATQMQKLVDQRNRTPHMPSTTVSPVEQPHAPVVQPGPTLPPNTWRGFLSWRGVDSGTNQRREMKTLIQLTFQTKHKSDSEPPMYVRSVDYIYPFVDTPLARRIHGQPSFR